VNRRRALGTTLAAALVAALGAGCSDDQPPGATNVVDPGSPVATSAAPTLPPAPLTGKPVAEAVATRQAVAVPLRVTADTKPAGLAEADLVYQEFAESKSLHLTAIYQSRDAARVGPVAEIRPVDVRTVGVLNPFVGFAGGPTGFLRQFAVAGLPGTTPKEKSSAFPSGQASVAALRKAAPKDGIAPTPVFDYATAPGDPLASQDVASAGKLTVAAPGHPTQTWTYDQASSSWRGRIGKETVSVASVVVLTMEYRTLTVRKPTRRSLPGANVYGTGAAVVVSGPSTVKGTWRKPSQKHVCNVIDGAGYQVTPQPGAAWVIYAPTTATVTVT
jgi:hypothetical protein